MTLEEYILNLILGSITFTSFGAGVAFSCLYILAIEETLLLSSFGLFCAMTGFLLSVLARRR
jgi:hypothetical protein